MRQLHNLIFITICSVILNSSETNSDLSEDQLDSALQGGETQDFHADVHRVLDIIINSLYQQKDIFLRELISNSSDAISKIRFMAVTNPDLLAGGEELGIKIELNADEKTLTLSDNGVGMSKAQLVENLGTIAKSGTANFVETIKEAQSNSYNDLIGQFGVGFYSVFLVADKVVVTSKSTEPSEDQYIWKSDATGSFTIVKDPRGNTLGRGTSIKLYLRSDALEFVKDSRIEEIVKKYSQFIHYPVMLKKEIEKTRDVPLSEDELKEVEEKEAADRKEKEDKGEPVDEPQEPASRTKKETYKEETYNQVNSSKPMWLKDPKEVTSSEYQGFYKTLTNLSDVPPIWTHFNAEGDINFRSIIFVRGQKSQSNGPQTAESQKTKVNLYVKRVLIGDEFDELLPFWMNDFIRGVIDSDDLPLNVSRETINQNKTMKVISKKTSRKVVDKLVEFAESEEAENALDTEYEDDKDNEEYKAKKEEFNNASNSYADFYKNFGDNIKQGMIHDGTYRSKLIELLRFKSTKTERAISFKQYVSRFIDGQDQIYYIPGDNVDVMKKNPLIQKLLKQGYEVLLFDKPLDEFAFQEVQKYEDYKLVNVSQKFTLPETDLDRRKFEVIEKDFKPMTDFFKKVMEKHVKDVKMSKLLVDYPVAVTTGEFGYTITQEKVWKAQSQGADNAMFTSDKNLEFNPHHEAIQALLKKTEQLNDIEDKDSDDYKTQKQDLIDAGWIYLEMAYINASGQVLNPNNLTKKLNRISNRNLGVDVKAAYKEYEVEVAEEPTKDSSDDDVNLEGDDTSLEDDGMESLDDNDSQKKDL